MSWRYEIKYILSPYQWLQMQQVLVEHPASFRTAYPDRTVNNIYFDTPDFATCRDNLAGISNRKKYRIRWYGDFKKIVNPVFEIKIKDNALGTKEIYPINDWDTNKEVDLPFLKSGFLRPVLQNQYRRSYYINMEENFRLTVDRAIKYQSVANHYLQNDTQAILDDRIIVELKFNAEDYDHQEAITRFIPFRPSKHSKYVTGVLTCW